MKLDKGKIINCPQLSKTIMETIMCHNKMTQTYWYRYRNLVSIPLKIVGIVSVSYRFEKAGIACTPKK